MKNLIYLILFTSFLSSCESPEVDFKMKDVSFTCPKGWRITETEDYVEEDGYYVSIEKDGLNSSGIVTIEWVADSFDLELWIETFKVELQNNIIFKTADLSFGDLYDSEFSGYETVSVDFYMNLFGLKHEGKYSVFHHENKTISVLKQGANEDVNANEPGFSIIENSFNVK